MGSGVRHTAVRLAVVPTLLVLFAAPSALAQKPDDSNGPDAPTSSTLQIPPVVERIAPDESVHQERGGSWTYEAPPRGDDADDGGSGTSTHQVVFLLDVSKSMPRVHTNFSEVIADVERRARSVLEPYRGTDLLEVSFYRFGDLRERDDGSWAPAVTPLSEGVDLTADEALEKLDTFLTTDPNAYDHDHTYVAASVYAATQRELDLPDDVGESIPRDRPPVSVLVFTDTGDEAHGGGESHAGGRGYRHERYAGWLETHRETHQLQYHYWNLETQTYPELPGDGTIVYSARWSDAGRADTFNRQEAVDDRSRTLDVDRRIDLVPALMDSGDADAIVCEERDERERVDSTRQPLELTLSGEPTYNIGAVDSYKPGRHTVRFPRDELCTQLVTAYPDSEFHLPTRGGTLQRLGYIEVVDEDRYTLEFGADGTKADASFPTLEADRLHRYGVQTRDYYLTAPDLEDLEVGVEWSARVFRDGEPVEDAAGFYSLSGADADRAMSATTAPGERVTLRTPGQHQRWWGMGADFPFEAGDYTVELCATPNVKSAPSDNYGLVFECQGCRPPNGASHTRCADVAVTVGERPRAWWTILLAALLAAVTLWALFRWSTAPRFPEGLYLTVWKHTGGSRHRLTEGPVARSDFVKPLDYAFHRFFGRPYYFVLIRDGRLEYQLDTPSPLVVDDGDEEVRLAIFAMRGALDDVGPTFYLCQHTDAVTSVETDASGHWEPVGRLTGFRDDTVAPEILARGETLTIIVETDLERVDKFELEIELEI